MHENGILCRRCKTELHIEATKCAACGAYQNWQRWIGDLNLVSVVALTGTTVAIFLGAIQLTSIDQKLGGQGERITSVSQKVDSLASSMSMGVFINEVQPNPITVLSGETVSLIVSVISIKEFPAARLVITNAHPGRVVLFDFNETGDQIFSDSKSLSAGTNHLTHEIGLRLQATNVTKGMLVGVIIHVVDGDGHQVSPETKILATIGV